MLSLPRSVAVLFLTLTAGNSISGVFAGIGEFDAASLFGPPEDIMRVQST